EQAPPPGIATFADRPRLLHQLAAKAGAEGFVERGLGRVNGAQHRRQTAKLVVLQDVVQIRVAVGAHSTGLSVAASSRSRVTPRWMSSFTAPADLPIATAM